MYVCDCAHRHMSVVIRQHAPSINDVVGKKTDIVRTSNVSHKVLEVLKSLASCCWGCACAASAAVCVGRW